MTTPTALTAIHRAALNLITEAQRCGVVVTIETTPHQPLAMGNHDMSVSVREARRPPPYAAGYTARLGSELPGIVATAQAQAKRLMDGNGGSSDLFKTLRVLQSAVQNGLLSLTIPAPIDCATELEALRKKVATYEAREALGWIPAPGHPDDVAVNEFAADLKAQLAKARAKGRSGWEDTAQIAQLDLAMELRRHLNKGDPLDVAALAMMLHMRGESTKLPALSQDLVNAIKNAPAGSSVIEHGGATIFISRDGDDGVPTISITQPCSELQAQVISVKRLAGEIVLQMVGGSEVPQEPESGMVVDLLYTPVQEGKQP